MIGRDLAEAKRREEKLLSESDPFSEEAATLEDLIAAKRVALETSQEQLAAWRSESGWLKELDTAFGRTGVQSFALEGVLGELQVMPGKIRRGVGAKVAFACLSHAKRPVQRRTAVFLEQLTSGTTLMLSASRPATATGRKEAAAVERITKTVYVRTGPGPADAVRERSVRQLSGGERRRVALALALGFADLISARSRLRCNLLVLDEVSSPDRNRRHTI